MTTTTHVHLYEEDHIETSRDADLNIYWLSLASDLRILIRNSKIRDEIIKNLTFMEFENENEND
jgi:hypothetical protein